MFVWNRTMPDAVGHLHTACAPNCLLEMVDVHFSYRDQEVLRGLTLHVHEQEIVALVGDNGAGKSTIAKLAIGELSPTSGRVELFCENPQHFRCWQHVGYVSQLVPGAVRGFPANVLELVCESQYSGIFAGRGHKLSAHERRARALEALETVGMTAYTHRLLRELSGGQLQRVRLACALVGNPELLVLDEPTTGLDAGSRDELYRLVAQAHEKRRLAVLMVTHDHAALHELGCRVLEVADGQASEQGGALC